MDWIVVDDLVPYETALAQMRAQVAAMKLGQVDERVWLLEHPPLYTAGSSAKDVDLLAPQFPVHQTGRGGQYTYHGPGQRVAYVMLNLKKRAEARGGKPDLRVFVQQLEAWLIATLAVFGIEGFIREGRVGVWVHTPTGEAKIAALGVRCEQWITSHGVALNVSPELSHYAGIVPCGLAQFGVTSMAQMGVVASMQEVDAMLEREFARIFVAG